MGFCAHLSVERLGPCSPILARYAPASQRLCPKSKTDEWITAKSERLWAEKRSTTSAKGTSRVRILGKHRPQALFVTRSSLRTVPISCCTRRYFESHTRTLETWTSGAFGLRDANASFLSLCFLLTDRSESRKGCRRRQAMWNSRLSLSNTRFVPLLSLRELAPSLPSLLALVAPYG
jgi:hypothetical protein